MRYINLRLTYLLTSHSFQCCPAVSGHSRWLQGSSSFCPLFYRVNAQWQSCCQTWLYKCIQLFIHRADMLQSITDCAPELLPCCHFSICIIIITLWAVHDYVTGGSSTKGTPGPLLFCNIIHPVLSSPGSALQIGYTNDITLGGSRHRNCY